MQLLLTQDSMAQTIPQDRLTNWTKAGLADTLPDFGNVVNIMNHGAVANGTTANDTALMMAIAALNNQPGTIYIPAGSYLFTKPVNLERDSIIIKGDGTATRLLFNLSSTIQNMFNIRGTIEPNIINVTQAIEKNDSSIVLASTTGVNTGDYIYIYHNDTGIIFSAWAYGSAGQIIRITKISGNTIFVDAPVRRNYPANSNIRIRKMKPVTYVGLECMYMERQDTTATQSNNIDFNAAANCWVTGIESNMTNFSHIAINYSTHILVRGCYFHHAHAYGGGGQAYGTTVEYTSGDCLIENNVFEHLRHSMLIQAGANGNVFAYNYSKDPYWTQPPFPTNAGGDMVCHGNYPYLNLFEGNIGQSIVVDDSHGINGPFNTFFRNRAELYGIVTVAAVADSMNYAGNEITGANGNYVLGGNGYFEHGNNVKGTINPANTTTIPEQSLYRGTPPGYWSGNAVYPSIGTPHAYSTGSNAAFDRYANNSKTDCERNPKYVTVGELKNKQDMLLATYPNPAGDYVYIQLPATESAGELAVVNSMGQKIYTTQTVKHRLQLKVHVSTWTAGWYYVIFTGANGEQAVARFVVQQ